MSIFIVKNACSMQGSPEEPNDFEESEESEATYKKFLDDAKAGLLRVVNTTNKVTETVLIGSVGCICLLCFACLIGPEKINQIINEMVLANSRARDRARNRERQNRRKVSKSD
jgi:hypothetical protein